MTTLNPAAIALLAAVFLYVVINVSRDVIADAKADRNRRTHDEQ